MQIPSSLNASVQSALQGTGPDAAGRLPAKGQAPSAMQKTFNEFLGETFYGQMLSSLRKTTGKPAYFDGGQAEEIFRGQLDQMLARDLANSVPQSFAGPMFDLFALQHK